MNNRNLIVLRAGDKSLHKYWLDHKFDRNWDVHISYYGKKDAPFDYAYAKFSRESGPKWTAVKSLIDNCQIDLDCYDYIAIPDDDLVFKPSTFIFCFEAMEKYGLELAQPSLSLRSFFTHDITLQRRGLKLRYTNFVELMSPFFSSSLLKRAYPYFDWNSTGWGMDFFWPTLIFSPEKKIAILDEVNVLHTRAIGIGPQYSHAKIKGTNAFEEKGEFISKLNIIPEIPHSYLALNQSGYLVTDIQKINRPLLVPKIIQKLRNKLGIKSAFPLMSRRW